jgi:hypothetical protein
VLQPISKKGSKMAYHSILNRYLFYKWQVKINKFLIIPNHKGKLKICKKSNISLKIIFKTSVACCTSRNCRKCNLFPIQRLVSSYASSLFQIVKSKKKSLLQENTEETHNKQRTAFFKKPKKYIKKNSGRR